MRTAVTLSLFLPLLAPLAAQEKPDAPEKPAEAPQLQANQQAFLNLPEEKRKEFLNHFTEANRLFQEKRIFETMGHVDKAAKIFKESPELYNLRGSCYVEMRAFDKALEQFREAAKFSKNNPSIEFNIGEVYFVTKEYAKAAEVFEKVQKLLPAENLAMGRLIEFKLLLCKIKTGKKNDAVILSEKYDFMDDSPFYYYAKAALAYDAANTMEAEEWLARANRIFRDPNILAPWQDTLVEFGYIKSFYGGDDAQSE